MKSRFIRHSEFGLLVTLTATTVAPPLSTAADSPIPSDTTTVFLRLTYPPAASVTPAPADWQNIRFAVAHGENALAITDDGQVRIWGNYRHQKVPLGIVLPPGLTNVVGATTGQYYSAVVTWDGRLIGWGSVYDSVRINAPFFNPVTLSNVVAVSSQYALTRRGQVVSWDDDGSGRTAVAGLSNVVAIACTDSRNLALLGNGRVMSWTLFWPPTPPAEEPPGLSNVVAIANAETHHLRLRADGQVVAGGGAFTLQENQPADLTDVVAISAAYHESLALTADGRIRSWGSVGPTLPPQPFLIPDHLTNVADVVAGGGFAVITTGQAPGSAAPVRLGPSTVLAEVEQPFQHRLRVRNGATRFQVDGLPSGLTLDEVTGMISGRPARAGEFHLTIRAENDRGTAAWGLDLVVLGGPVLRADRSALARRGRPFALSVTADNAPVRFEATGLPPGITIDPGSGQLSGSPTEFGTFHVSLLASNRHGTDSRPLVIQVPPVVTWGPNGIETGSVSEGLEQAVALTIGTEHAFALTSRGQAVRWGPPPARGVTNSPADVPDLVAVVTGAGTASLAITRDGRVLGWNVPPVPAGLSNVVAVAVGEWPICLTADGRTLGWDWRGFFTGPSHSVAIAAYLWNYLSLQEDGRVITWGRDSIAPPPPEDLRDVIAIAAGSSFNLALTAAGQVVAWSQVPSAVTQIPAGLRNVVAIAAGSNHALALTAEGRVIAWGDNFTGETLVPEDLGEVVAIAAGAGRSAALLRHPGMPELGFRWARAADGAPALLATGAAGMSAVALETPSLGDPWRATRPVTLGGESEVVATPSATEPARFYRLLRR